MPIDMSRPMMHSWWISTVERIQDHRARTYRSENDAMLGRTRRQMMMVVQVPKHKSKLRIASGGKWSWVAKVLDGLSSLFNREGPPLRTKMLWDPHMPELRSVIELDSTTLRWFPSPMELQAERLEVPLFIPQRDEHFNPNQVMQSSAFAFKMNHMANLRFLKKESSKILESTPTMKSRTNICLVYWIIVFSVVSLVTPCHQDSKCSASCPSGAWG